MKKRTLLLLSVLLLLCAAAFLLVKRHVALSGNEAARFAVAESILERGTTAIDGSMFRTPDKAELGGRFYGDKPPLLTFFAAGCGWLLMRFGLSFQETPEAMIGGINMVFFLLTCMTGVFLHLAMRRKGAGFAFSAFAGFCAVATTLVLPYAVTIGNHGVCAALLMMLLWLCERGEDAAWTGAHAFCAGLAAGLVFNVELVAGGTFGLGVFLLIATAPGAARERMRRIGLYAIGGAALLLAEGAMNAVNHGSPLPLYLLTHRPDLAERDAAAYAWDVLFGAEGIFLYTPALLAILPAIGDREIRRDRVFRCMTICCAAATAIFILSTSDRGGWCYGFRFLVPLSPILLFYGFLALRRKNSPAAWALFAAALLWGGVAAGFGVCNPWVAKCEGKPDSDHARATTGVRNAFLANVLVFCWDRDPDGRATRFLMDRVYGRNSVLPYLFLEHVNRGDEDGARRVLLAIPPEEEALPARAGNGN